MIGITHAAGLCMNRYPVNNPFKLVCAFLVINALCICPKADANILVDPFPGSYGNRVIEVSGHITDVVQNGTFYLNNNDPATSVFDYNLPVSDYVYGITTNWTVLTSSAALPADVYYGRGLFSDSGAYLKVEEQHGGRGNGTGGSSVSIRAYTDRLPVGASFVYPSTGSFFGTVSISVYAATPGGVPLPSNWSGSWFGSLPLMAQGDHLGGIAYQFNSGYQSWTADRWDWDTSYTNLAVPPSPIITSLGSGTGPFDFSQVGQLASNIVNGRTNDYYYVVGADVSATDKYYGGYSSTRVDFERVPEHGASVMLLFMGLASIAAMRRRFGR